MEDNSYVEVKNSNYHLDVIPTVSVCMIAYNVGKFLPEAIESVLMQKTNFKVELVIGEDCSPDNTREIALFYRDKYPGIIRVLLPEKNQGLTPNSVATQNACTGKYIALLDGDDYWIGEGKLQKQIDFLENNPRFSGSAHQAIKVYDDGSSVPQDFGMNEDSEFGLLDTIGHRKFHTSSLVYRKEIWDKTGGIPTEICANERAIYPMLAIYGKIKYFKDCMCIYRLSSVGISSRITYQELKNDLKMLPWLKGLDRNFPISKFRSFIHLTIYTYPARIPFFPLMKHFFLFLFFSFAYFPANLRDLKYGFDECIKKCKF